MLDIASVALVTEVAAPPAPQRRAAVVTPLAPERYKLQVTLSRETHDKLRRAQALARHALPDGDVGSILDRALTLLIDHLERRRFARVASPRREPRARVLHRDATYRRPSGGPCGSAMRDAARSWDGQAGAARPRSSSSITSRRTTAGGAGTADNIQLRCRAHNQYEARLFFGDSARPCEQQEMWITFDRSDR